MVNYSRIFLLNKISNSLLVSYDTSLPAVECFNPWSPGEERNIGFLCTIYVPPVLKGLRTHFLMHIFLMPRTGAVKTNSAVKETFMVCLELFFRP